jgi:hypothetical protein
MVQPLDVGCFGPYKRYYGVEVDNATRNGITAINKTIFIDLIQKARWLTLTQSTILGAWRGAGLVPFDPDLVLTQLPNYAPLRPQTPVLPAPTLTVASITTPTTSTGVSLYLSTIQERSAWLLSSPTLQLIDKVGKVAETSFARDDIAMETQTQLRASNKARKGRKDGDRAILSKARVITTEKALQLLKERQPKKATKVSCRGRPSKVRAAYHAENDLVIDQLNNGWLSSDSE